MYMTCTTGVWRSSLGSARTKSQIWVSSSKCQTPFKTENQIYRKIATVDANNKEPLSFCNPSANFKITSSVTSKVLAMYMTCTTGVWRSSLGPDDFCGLGPLIEVDQF
jgi:hypothetical protein